MGLFGGKERKRQAFVEKAEELAGSAQFEFYKSSAGYLEKKYDHETSVKIATALTNYVFRFGHVAPIHASNPKLMTMIEAEAGEYEYNLAVKYAGLREDQTTNKALASAAMGRLLRKALLALILQQEARQKKE